jgi:hypothetical protein
MNSSINSLGSLPASNNGGVYASPRQAANPDVYGNYGLSPEEEAKAKEFGNQAANGNFWRGAALWGSGAAFVGLNTVSMERQWLKETHSSYTNAKKAYLNQHLSSAQKTALGITGPDINLNATELNLGKGRLQNIFNGDNPFKGVGTVMSNADDYAKVALNAVDPAKLATDVKLTKTTGLMKGGLLAGAILTVGLLTSNAAAANEGNATQQLARQRLAMLKAQEALAQRGQG